MNEGEALVRLKLAGMGVGLVETLAMQDDTATRPFTA
jgi:hypothetical protein